MEYIATGRKTIQDQSVDVARNALSQRILKAAQQYEELSEKREKVMNNSRRQPIDHDLMYAGISLASFKQNCEELVPIVAASTDQSGYWQRGSYNCRMKMNKWALGMEVETWKFSSSENSFVGGYETVALSNPVQSSPLSVEEIKILSHSM